MNNMALLEVPKCDETAPKALRQGVSECCESSTKTPRGGIQKPFVRFRCNKYVGFRRSSQRVWEAFVDIWRSATSCA